MDNYERIAKVFFTLEEIGKNAGMAGRFTNRMVKQIERNRIILNSMKNDEEMRPFVEKALKVISLWVDFAKAFNSGNSFDSKRLSNEAVRLCNEIKALIVKEGNKNVI